MTDWVEVARAARQAAREQMQRETERRSRERSKQKIRRPVWNEREEIPKRSDA